jgi:hypothetical protein
MQFTSTQHAGAFAFALFGLCAVQSVMLLGSVSANQTAAVVPSAYQLENPDFDASIKQDLREIRRLRNPQIERRTMKREPRMAMDEAHEACGALREVVEALHCDAE